MRRALLIVGIAVVLVLVAATGAGVWLLRDPSIYIPRLEAAATRALGRPVHIGRVRLHPDLTVEGFDVTMPNPSGRGRAELLIVPRVVASVGLLGLASGVLDIDDLRLERPDLVLDTAGLDPPDSSVPVPPARREGSGAGGSIRLRLRFHAVTVVDGHAVVAGVPIDVPHARALRQGDGWALTASLVSRGDTAEISATRPDAGGFGIDATGHLTLPPNALLGDAPGRSDVVAHVGSDATRISVLHGARRVGLTTAPVAALLVPGPQPVELLVEQPGLSLHAIGHAARDGAFDVSVEGHAPDLATMLPKWPAGPASLGGHAAGQVAMVSRRGHIAFDHFSLTTAIGDISGDVAFADDGPTRSVTGTLAAKRLDVDALLRVFATPEPAAPATLPAVPAATTPPVSPPQILFARLGAATGDLTLSADSLTVGGIALHAARLHATLADARLVLDPVAAETVAGPARASMTVDSGGQPPTIVLMLQAPSLRLITGPLTGTVSIRAALNTSGNDFGALLANLVGSASVAAVDGELDPSLIGPALLAVAQRLHVKLTIGPTRFRCAVARVAALDGVATIAPLTVETPRLLVTGQGTADLGAKTLSLKVRPVLKQGIGLSLPLTVSGGWEAPAIASDPRPAATLPGDACATSLAAIGVALPLPPPEKPQKAADLLKGLLR